jgi:hypothetical protein
MTSQIPSCNYDGHMPPKSTIGMALAAYRLWRRMPPAQRRLVLDQARVHGPKAAAAAAALLKSRKKP